MQIIMLKLYVFTEKLILKKSEAKMNIDVIFFTELSIKIIMIILSLIMLFSCFLSMKNQIRKKNGLIILQNEHTKQEIPVLYWENSIGRSKYCDIIVDDPTASREHAVLFRRKDGWFLLDTNSKTGVFVNGQRIKKKTKLNVNDKISFGTTSLVLHKTSDSREIFSNSDLTKKTKPLKPARKLFLVTLFIILAFTQPTIKPQKIEVITFIPILVFIVLSWTFFLISIFVLKRCTFELETLAIFLSGIGLTLINYAKPGETLLQLVAIGSGMCLFCFMIWFIKNPDLVCKMRFLIAITAITLFIFNLIFAKEINGAKNWIKIATISFQPSEFIKIAFIFVGTSTLDELQTTKNLSGFIIFSAICIVFLFFMKDFGTACIFFVTFLIIAFMRSGSLRTIILSCSAASLGLFLILTFKPYIKDRFAVWGHVWEQANELGYQQTRVLTYSASGGLLGVGVGNGYLKNIFSATGDLIWGMICEELGLIIAIVVALIIAGIAFFAHFYNIKSRSTFYSIASCAAATMLITQAALHIFGTTDVLPLTGVTLPFVSHGGSSMISSFALLSFIKAADERTYALKRK